jgi:axial budding pattern protein 2
VGFASSTFTVAPNQTLFYHSSPLPDWIKFDRDGLDFDGVVPKWPLNTTASFRFLIHGSDQEGFSAVNQAWNLIVAAHELGQNHSLSTFNLTTGQNINQTITLADLDGIVFDRAPLESLANLSASLDTSCCSWLTATNFSLSGRAPSDTGSFVLPLSLHYPAINQTLRTSLNLSVISSVFTQSELPDLTASPGSQVQFDLSRYLVNPETSKLNITISAPDAPWLSFDSQTLKLSGKAPKDGEGTKLTVKFNARDSQTGQLYTARLPVTVSNQSESSAAAASSSSVSPKKLRTILAAVFGSIAGFVIICATAACCRARNNARRDRAGGMYVIDQRGQGYWREKGALDGGFTYENPIEPSLKSMNPVFEDVHLTPVPNNGSTHGSYALELGTPASLLPGGRMRKGEFFTLVKNSLSRKNKKRPFISNPVPVIMSDNATVSHVVNSVEGSYHDRCVSSYNFAADIADLAKFILDPVYRVGASA